MTDNLQRPVAGVEVGGETALSVAPLGTPQIPAYLGFDVTDRNGDNRPTEIEYYADSAGTILVATMVLTYDGDNIDTMRVIPQ